MEHAGATADLTTARTPPRRPAGTRITQGGAVVSTAHAGGLSLIDMASGRRVTLDAFGSRVWSELAHQPTLAALVMRLRDDGARAEQLAEDVTRLLARWRGMGLIVWR